MSGRWVGKRSYEMQAWRISLPGILNVRIAARLAARLEERHVCFRDDRRLYLSTMWLETWELLL